jgi:hypothetical protein
MDFNHISHVLSTHKKLDKCCIIFRNSGWLVGNEQFQEIFELVTEINTLLDTHKDHCEVLDKYNKYHIPFEDDLDALTELCDSWKHLWYRDPTSVKNETAHVNQTAAVPHDHQGKFELNIQYALILKIFMQWKIQDDDYINLLHSWNTIFLLNRYRGY